MTALPRSFKSFLISTGDNVAVKLWLCCQTGVIRRGSNWCFKPTESTTLHPRLHFGNPFLDLDRAQPFMWPCIVAVFCPESSDKHQPRPPVWLPLDVQRGAAQPGRAQRCHLCRKWRVLPRSLSLPRSSNTAAPLPMTCRSCIEPMEMYKIGTR